MLLPSVLMVPVWTHSMPSDLADSLAKKLPTVVRLSAMDAGLCSLLFRLPLTLPPMLPPLLLLLLLPLLLLLMVLLLSAQRRHLSKSLHHKKEMVACCW